MEAIGISGTCVGLIAGITALSKELTNFVNRTREARKDVDGFSRELASISLCVSSLKDENFNFPLNLQRQLALVLRNCERTVQDMDKIVRKHSNAGIGRRMQWSLNDGQDVARLRERLEAHKSTLDITLDLGQLALVSGIRDDTRDIRAELYSLRLQISNLERSGVNERPMLQRFLEDSMTYAESVVDLSDADDEDPTPQTAKSINAQSGRVSSMVPSAEVLTIQPSRTTSTLKTKSSDGHQQNGRSKGKLLARLGIISDNGYLATPRPFVAPPTQGATHPFHFESPAKLLQTISEDPDYQYEGRRCSVAYKNTTGAAGMSPNVYFSFSCVPIDVFHSGSIDLGLSGPEELAWVNETSRGVFYRWKDITRFAYEEGGPKGNVQTFWVLHGDLFNLYGPEWDRSLMGLEICHVRTGSTRILYEENRSNRRNSELFPILEQAKQDAKNLAPIITNLDSFKKNVRMLKQDRSERTIANLVPGTFSVLVEREREDPVQD
jgi:hypothetical protein